MACLPHAHADSLIWDRRSEITIHSDVVANEADAVGFFYVNLGARLEKASHLDLSGLSACIGPVPLQSAIAAAQKGGPYVVSRPGR